MSYHISKTTGLGFDDAVAATVAALQSEGFGVLTDIDVAATMQAKLGAPFRPYRILGACNPRMAHEALKLEDKVGTLLPCNVIVQQHDDGSVEVSAIDPVTSMQGIGNPDLGRLAGAVREMLRNAVNRIA